MKEKFFKVIPSLWIPMVFVGMTFYMDDAYFNLLGSKAYIFFCMALLYAILMLFWERKQIDAQTETFGNKGLNPLDYAVLAFAGIALLSTVFSQYKADALWGHYGWAVGSLYILTNAVIYFWTSRRMQWKDWMYLVIKISAAVIFLWALADEFYFDIFGMHNPIEAETAYNYLASIGNNNWFSGYWALVVPFFVFGIKKGPLWKNVLSLAGLFLSVFVGVNCRADSLYLGFGVILAISLLRAIGGREKSTYTGIAWMVMSLAMGAAKGVRTFTHMIELDEIALKMMNSNLWIVLFAVGVLFVVFPSIRGKKYIRFALVILGIGAVCVIGYTQIQNFGTTWGTGRGETWMLALKAFQEGTFLEKIIGIGPDCFGYAYRSLTGSSLFRNAHNEYLQYLVTMGITGVISYVAIYTGVFFHYISRKKKGMEQNAEKERLKTICFTAIMAYAAQAIVNNPQALNGAIFFTVLAIFRAVDYTKDSEVIRDAESKAGSCLNK